MKLFAVLRANWQALYFSAALLGLAFAYGVAVGVYQLFPYPVLNAAVDAFNDWREHSDHYLRIRPEKQLFKARFEGEGLVTHDRSRTYPGVTLLSGLFGDSLGMVLLDQDGNPVHEWMVSFNEIYDQAPHLSEKPHDWDMNLHGGMLYPNGDVVFNFEYNGLVRLDRCGRVLWKVFHETHHQIYEDAQGFLWTSGQRIRDKALDRLPNMAVPLTEEYILKVSPQGEIVQEISLLDVFYDSNLESILFAHGWDKTKPTKQNITHLNDVEVLDGAKAAAFDEFEEGDILVSIRNLNMIGVIDPDTETFKWWQIGPFIRQHDPDFLGNGRISVFDNRKDDVDGAVFDNSRILQLDPTSRAVSVRYDGSEERKFFTNAMGTHETLPNDNVLMVEAFGGRALEVTPAGEIVWEYINRWDDDEVALLDQAMRYPESYLEFVGEGCEQ